MVYRNVKRTLQVKVWLNCDMIIPQTVLALRGSGGVAKEGAMKCLRLPSFCRGAQTLLLHTLRDLTLKNIM